MEIRSISHILFLTIFLTLFIPSSILITAKTSAYPSIATPPASWLLTIDLTALGAADVKPVLVNGSFTCGFHCEYIGEITCLFAISFSDSLNNFTPSPLIVWSANRNHPVTSKAVLNFTREGDLVLEDGNGALVWSTNTTAMSLSRLSLSAEGNLVLLGKNDEVIWQSFDHPTDSLVPGQGLVSGTKLTSSVSASNSSEGLYSLTIDDNGYLVAYTGTNKLQSYYSSWKELYIGERGNYYVDFWRIIDRTIYPYDYYDLANCRIIKLGSDGHLEGYLPKNSSWVDIIDVPACDYPLVCGKYGFCSGSGSCSCYGEISDHLIPENNERPDLGCSLKPPVSCKFPHDQRLIPLLNHSLNSFTLASYITNADEEDCKQACLRNCSCKAVIFLNNYFTNYTNSCSLASEVFSISWRLYDVNPYDDKFIKVFIKVQDFPSTLTLHRKNLSLVNNGDNRAVIMGSTLGAIFALLLLCSLGMLLLKKYSRKVDEDHLDHISGLPTRFSYQDLKVMTKNFSDKIGEGGFGSVFKGTLSTRDEVAVKHLDGFGSVNKSFVAEVQTIGSIHHFNLVSLVGFCAENFQRLLVYEYMSNGSLDQWIFNRNKDLPVSLSWEFRKKIILDVAKGLAYLHEGCNQKIIHLDIKPQNILLDDKFNAKVSDFGLSKLIGRNQSQVVTTMRGTPGYMAPEWLSSIITEKVDVYSFGIVVLEIVCGRPNVDRSQPEEDMHLVSLFKRKAEDEQLLDLVEESGEDMQSNFAEVMKTMKVAACCLQMQSRKRPSMSKVVSVLEGSIDDIEEFLCYDFSNLPGPEARTTVSLTLPSILSGPR